MQNLIDTADDYALLRGLSRSSAYALRRAASLFAEWLGRPATTDDLTDDQVSRWIAWLQARRAAWTCSGNRTRLLCLWRFAVEQHGIPGPGRIRPARPPEPHPEAWTAAEVQRLVAACRQIGAGGGYMAVLIVAAWESGLRRSDLWSVRREQIDARTGVIALTQHKTGHVHEARLRPETAASVLSLSGPYPLACPWGPKKYTRVWRRLRKLAGVGDGGGLQKLRRSGATAVAIASGETGDAAARQFLGHRSPGMWAWYVDRRQWHPRGILPPPLAE